MWYFNTYIVTSHNAVLLNAKFHRKLIVNGKNMFTLLQKYSLLREPRFLKTNNNINHFQKNKNLYNDARFLNVAILTCGIYPYQ
jgi:hypothetical protein